MNPVKGIDDSRNDYDDTQQFVSEQKQIARMADEKSPARISHRRFATKSLRNEENVKNHKS